jgi:omega-6 fatty acid desaturase (delta-12 desaturase)
MAQWLGASPFGLAARVRLKPARRRACRSTDSAAAAIPDPLATLKRVKRQLIERHVRPDDRRGLLEVALTLLPLGLLAWAARLASTRSMALTAAITLLASLFLLRAFVLMHECGHGSLFRSARLNRGFGFVFGVISGMPQFVWSQHHQFHHAHNGDWDRYRGPLNIVTTTRYDAMSAPQQRQYRNARRLWLAPLGGFMYAIVNPRVTWVKGSFGLLRHLMAGRNSQPGESIGARAASFKTPCWSSMQEYRHMSANNAALLALWALLAWLMGPLLFVGFCLVGSALASGAGLVLFTVQHNFEHAYASRSDGWDYDRGAIEGTSFLVLPGWLNWFTVNIGYHHIHHLSARIPSYCLAGCQLENAHLFTRVTRIRLAQVPAAVKCILWDTVAQRIVSVAEHQAAPRPA